MMFVYTSSLNIVYMCLTYSFAVFF